MPPEVTSPIRIFDGLENELKDALHLITFFSRCFVSFNKIEIIAPVNRGLTYPSPQRVYVHNEHHYSEQNIMFDFRCLSNGIFSKILLNYRKSEFYRALSISISFLVSSYSDKCLETRYFLIHSALESICKNMTKDIPITKKTKGHC